MMEWAVIVIFAIAFIVFAGTDMEVWKKATCIICSLIILIAIFAPVTTTVEEGNYELVDISSAGNGKCVISYRDSSNNTHSIFLDSANIYNSVSDHESGVRIKIVREFAPIGWVYVFPSATLYVNPSV